MEGLKRIVLSVGARGLTKARPKRKTKSERRAVKLNKRKRIFDCARGSMSVQRVELFISSSGTLPCTQMDRGSKLTFPQSRIC
jgi:hypothetical protein